ncbi:hypothetical protein QCA50_020884 [Cerrena zonata]|uniref:F-box domain-containing protein n=1 Tax=Cerrena zonata TaxID=2478898 RepID=A0AAW0FF70_9APHY
MHRCLLIDELLRIIAYDLRQDVYPVQRENSDLVNFILTCQTFCEPGLDILWDHLVDPLPLVHLFPNRYTLSPDCEESTRATGEVIYDSDHDGLDSESSGDEEENSDGERSIQSASLSVRRQRIYDLTSIPTAAQWERFDYYARRIKRLDYELDVYHPYLSKLAQGRVGRALLPNLRCLLWNTTNVALFDHIQLFLPKTLISLKVYGLTTKTSLRLLELLSERQPSLEMFHFSHGNLDITHKEAITFSSLISQYTNMHSLVVECHLNTFPISKDALQALSMLPHLCRLWIEVDSELMDSSMPVHIDDSSKFPSLCHFTVIWRNNLSTRAVDTIIKSIHSRKLYSVLLYPRFAFVEANLVDIVSSLSHHTSLCMLRILHRDPMIYRHHAGTHSTPIATKALIPLFRLSNLEIIVLEGCILDFTGSLIKDMATSWPRLQNIRIKERNRICPDSRMDVLDLMHFATQCPDIRDISIPFYSDLAHAEDIPHCTLPDPDSTVVVDGTWADVGELMYTAAFLHTVFCKPHIRGHIGSRISGMGLREARMWLTIRPNDDGTIRWEERV